MRIEMQTTLIEKVINLYLLLKLRHIFVTFTLLVYISMFMSEKKQKHAK